MRTKLSGMKLMDITFKELSIFLKCEDQFVGPYAEKYADISSRLLLEKSDSEIEQFIREIVCTSTELTEENLPDVIDAINAMNTKANFDIIAKQFRVNAAYIEGASLWENMRQLVDSDITVSEYYGVE